MFKSDLNVGKYVIITYGSHPFFRRNVWIKRGDFVVVSKVEEGDKVKSLVKTVITEVRTERRSVLITRGCLPSKNNKIT